MADEAEKGRLGEVEEESKLIRELFESLLSGTRNSLFIRDVAEFGFSSSSPSSILPSPSSSSSSSLFTLCSSVSSFEFFLPPRFLLTVSPGLRLFVRSS